MKNRALDQLEQKILSLRPERTTITVDLNGEEVEVSICEAHRMLHRSAIKCDDIKGEWATIFTNMGNCSADMEAWFHILRHHMSGMHGELSKKRTWEDVSEEEAHEKLLNDMASGQTVKL